MDLGVAIANAWGGGPDGSDARRIVGAHLAAEVRLGAGSVVLGIGGWGLELIVGAQSVTADLRRYGLGTQAGRQGRRAVAWITAKPPADRPLTIFTAAALTGVDVVAVLDDLRRDGLPPVTVCAARLRPVARDLIHERYPAVGLVTPTLDRQPASTPDGATRS